MGCTRILLAPRAMAGLLGTYLYPIRFNSNESAASVRFTSQKEEVIKSKNEKKVAGGREHLRLLVRHLV